MTVLARPRVVLTGDSVQLTKALQGASAAMEQAGAKMTRMGRTMSLRITAPLVGIGAAATKMGSDFEREMSKIVGLVGVSQDQVDAWGKDILDLAPQLGRAPRELAEGLFFVTSAGFRGAEAMDVLETSARAATAGLGDTATIADAVTSAINAYGAENLSASKAADVLTAAVREGKLEAESIAPVLGNLLPTAAAMGVSFEAVAGTLAVFSRTGADAAAGATSLQAIMLTLQKPTKQTRDMIEGAGLSMDGLRKTAAGPGGLVAVMRQLESAFGDNDEALAQIFPNIRAFRGVMNALAQDADVVDGILDGVTNSTGALDHAFETAAQTARVRMDKALVQMQTSLIRIGEVIMPMVATAFERFASVLGAVSKLFSDMPKPIQLTIVGMAGLLAATGPVLVALGSLIGLAKVLTTALVAMKIPTATVAMVAFGKSLVAAAAGAKGFAAGLTVLKVAMGPAGWLVLGLTAAAAGVALLTRRIVNQNRAIRENAERLNDYRAALAGWTQEARQAEGVRLEDALARQRAELERLQGLAEMVGRSVDDISLPGATRAEAIQEEKRLQDQIATQRQLVQRLEEDHKAVAAAIRDGASEATGLKDEIDNILSGIGGGGGLGDEVREAMETLVADLREAGRMNDLLGDSFNLGEARAEAYGRAVQALAASQAGLDAAVGDGGESVRGLAEEYLRLAGAAEESAEAQRRAEREQQEIDSAVQGLTDSLRDAKMLNDLLGDSYDLTGAQAAAYGQIVRRLVAAEVDLATVIGPQGETLGELADRYLDLTAEVERNTRAEREAADVREEGARATASMMTPLETYEATVARLGVLLTTVDEETGRAVISQETYTRAIIAAQEEYRRATEELGYMGQQMVWIAAQGVDAFAAFATGAGDSMRRFVQRALQDLARLIARMLVARALLATLGPVGWAVSLAGALDPTARRHGGPVKRGELYMTGEAGRELFVPDTDGHIFSAPDTSRILAGAAVPAMRMSGGGGGALAAAGGGASGPGLTIDFSTFPRATNPLAAARDDEWQRFLRESERLAYADGFDPRR